MKTIKKKKFLENIMENNKDILKIIFGKNKVICIEYKNGNAHITTINK